MSGQKGFTAYSYMAAIVGIVSTRGYSIDVHHGNQPNKSSLNFKQNCMHCYVALSNVF